MSIQNIDKHHLNLLIEIPNLEELNKDKIIQSIQRNSNNYSKLKILFKQMEFLKKEIEDIVIDSLENEQLEKINCSFKKNLGIIIIYMKDQINLYFFL